MEYPDPLIDAFDHSIIVRKVDRPNRLFNFHVTFQNEHPLIVEIASKKPPLHFHSVQREYLEVLKGTLKVFVEGKEMTMKPEDGELLVEPWTNHCLYADSPEPTDDGPDLSNTTEFLVSGDHTDESYRLDYMFFENWYAYQNDIVTNKKSLSTIQLLSMFDAGGSYVTLPWWIPFRGRVSQVLGIVIGRWLGGLLGYAPFYKKWTTDWQLACDKMASSPFHRKFATHSKDD